MDELAGNAQLYIRSIGSRSRRDGLADNLPEMLDLMDEFGFDEVLLETVGVGQAEYAARAQVDTLVLVLLPESGDMVQAMKAGIMEMADIFVVNKADLPGAQKHGDRHQAHRGDGAPCRRTPGCRRCCWCVLASPIRGRRCRTPSTEHQAWLREAPRARGAAARARALPAAPPDRAARGGRRGRACRHAALEAPACAAVGPCPAAPSAGPDDHRPQETHHAFQEIEKWAALLALGALAAAGQAQDFPTRPVKILVPQTPGGASDALARIIAQKLSEKWGQPVVVENRAGAGGNVGMEAGRHLAAPMATRC